MSAKGQDRLRADCSNKGSAGGSLNRLSASVHAVPTNGPTLTAFRFHVTNLCPRTLRRASQKERTARLANDWLPKPRILHPWRALPSSTQGGSRMPADSFCPLAFSLCSVYKNEVLSNGTRSTSENMANTQDEQADERGDIVAFRVRARTLWRPDMADGSLTLDEAVAERERHHASHLMSEISDPVASGSQGELTVKTNR